MSRIVKPARRRRARGSLARQDIVDAALQLANAEGLESLSMASLAARLNCGVMTLYGHIQSKEDLLDAIALRALADVRLPRPLPAEPRAILIAWGQALRTTFLQHPSMPLIFLARPVIGPAIFRGIEALVSALARSGTPPATAVHAVYALLIYTTGFVAWELPRTRRHPESAYAAAWRREFASLDPADFPITRTVLDELPRVAGTEQFQLGLSALASGLASSSAPS